MTQFSHRDKLLIACLAIIFIGNISGCRTAHRVGMTETGAPQYDKLSINYELRNSSGALALKEFSQDTNTEEDSVILQAGANVDQHQSDKTDWSRANLQIQYPHPNGSSELVRATLRLSKGTEPLQQPETSWKESWTEKLEGGWETLKSPFSDEEETALHQKKSSDTDDEIWVYDFPKSQLDLMLTDLARSGFFENQTRPNGTASLSVSINRGHVSKDWSPEPRLDDIILLVYQEGWLGGFAKNETLPTPKTETIKTVGYEE